MGLIQKGNGLIKGLGVENGNDFFVVLLNCLQQWVLINVVDGFSQQVNGVHARLESLDFQDGHLHLFQIGVLNEMKVVDGLDPELDEIGCVVGELQLMQLSVQIEWTHPRPVRFIVGRRGCQECRRGEVKKQKEEEEKEQVPLVEDHRCTTLDTVTKVDSWSIEETIGVSHVMMTVDSWIYLIDT